MLVFRKHIISLFLLFVSLGTGSAQCGSENGADITDLVETEVEISISGAVNDDLAAPEQGVCAVYLEFQHTHVGDIQIELEAPSGQRIQLIGQPGEVTGPTDLTNWDIQFVPCIEPAEPDMGFSPVWDNDQNWGIIGNYTGAYHPNDGCLEDFDTGVVNGTWRIIISDDVIFDEGEVLRFCIQFCDDEGIDCLICQICDADAGSIKDTAINYCQSDLPLQLQIPVEDSAYIDSTFQTQYYVWQGDVVFDSSSSHFVEIDYNPGIYTLCALNSLISDSFFLTLGDSIPIDSIQDLLDETSQPCADLSNCIQIEIFPIPDTIHIDTHFCAEANIIFKGESYDSQGIYSIAIPGPVCDTMYILNLDEIQILTVLNSDYVNVNCTQAFRADALLSEPNSYDSAHWYFENQFVQSSDTIIIFEEGELCLTVFEKECSQELCIQIDFEEILPPNINGLDEFCPGDSILLTAEGDFNFQWSNGILGDSSDYNTDGDHFLIFFDSLACPDTVFFSLSQHEVDSVEIFGEDSICSGFSANLSIDLKYDSILWNNESNESEIELTEQGWVSVSANDTNFCRSSDSLYLFVQDGPELELRNIAFACGTPGGESGLFFDTLIVNGSLTGAWEDIDGSGAVGVFPNLDFLGVVPGVYNFGYTTDNAIPPCTDISDTISITVFDCACPIMILYEDSVALCIETESDSIFLNDLLFSSESGGWTIRNGPINSDAAFNDTWFVYNQGDSGLYDLRFELFDSIPGCGASIDLRILLSQPYYVELNPEVSSFCFGTDSQLQLNDLLVQAASGAWILPDELLPAFDAVNNVLEINEISVGSYDIIFSGESQEPCPSFADTITLEILEKPTISLIVDNNIPCLGNFGQISADFDGDEAYWYTEMGGIIGDSSNATIQVSLPGWYYFVSHIDQCSALDSIYVINIDQAPEWDVDFSDSICAGSNDGFIIIDNISSGNNSLVFVNEVLQQNDSLLGIGFGEYIITIVDSVGCFRSDTVNIDEIHEAFTITPDTSIYLGDSLVIEVIEQIGQVDMVHWLENGEIIPQDEISFKEFPMEATNFSAFVISSNGCTFELETQIGILDAGFIYVPNVFTPNGDDRNDSFLAFGNDRFWNISEMNVFNRFGEQVFKSENHKPGDLSFAWDGNFKGKRAAVGVYSYFVVVYNNNGQYRMLKGDVTLLR